MTAIGRLRQAGLRVRHSRVSVPDFAEPRRSNLRAMTAANVTRWAVSAGWLIVALLLERIVTLGAITDLSEVSQNPPEFVATGLGLIVIAVAIAILVAADARRWPSFSIAASGVYVVVGIWLRQEEDDDSAAAIVLIAVLLAALAGATLALRRRDEPRSPPPGE